MEPTSNSQSERAPDAADAVYVCKVCHQSIPPTADRAELVHRACLAELRCGVTLNGAADRRTRELDSV